MKTPLQTLFAPSDPVVSVHEGPESAHAAVAALANAGFHGSMLSVVGLRCPRHDATAVGERSAALLRCLSTSGLAWGLLWGMLLLGFAVAAASNDAALAALPILCSLFIVVQFVVVAVRVAPEAACPARWHSPTRVYGGHEHDLAAERLLLVVDGSRSDVALARAILRV